ncbi:MULTISPECIES: helix-turn-helix domain-containing protein [Bacteria]|uniref:helix-turn-helix domain-containing protein n=1 Tax=Bacteria TaxID=2 RepID=UPI003C7DE2A0
MRRTTNMPTASTPYPLSTLAWRPLPPEPQRWSVEATAHDSWVVARVWSTAGSLRAKGLDDGWTRVILGVDGMAEVSVNDGSLQIRPHEALFLRADDHVTTTNSGIWARCEWQLHAPTLRQEKFARSFGRALPLQADYYALLTTMTNATSTQPTLGQTGGAGMLLDAFTGVAVAAMLDATGETERLSATQTAILQDARAVIEQRYMDSAFDAGTLASTLGLSARHLRRPFAAVGTTPSRAIEERRLDAADSVLRVTPARSRGTLEQVATIAGFSSARRLRDALKRRSGQER